MVAFPVYLRVYGAVSSSCLHGSPFCGLPPCVRSGSSSMGDSNDAARFTSVCTERLSGRFNATWHTSVYLRVYGAVTPPTSDVRHVSGLPPCVRSGWIAVTPRDLPERFTSVCTERFCRCSPIHHPRTVYLRVYGAVVTKLRYDGRFSGLPPCVRSGSRCVGYRLAR